MSRRNVLERINIPGPVNSTPEALEAWARSITPLLTDTFQQFGYAINNLDILLEDGDLIDDRVATLIQNGTGLSWTYDDPNDTLTGDVSLAPFDTDDLSEGSNLYFTNERVDDRVATLIQNGTGLSWTYDDPNDTLTGDVSLVPFSTTDLSEGSNLYFTNERVDDRVNALIQNGTGLSWTYDDGANTLTGDVSLSPCDTDDLSEGASNLYYTDARGDERLDAAQTISASWLFTDSITLDNGTSDSPNVQFRDSVNSTKYYWDIQGEDARIVRSYRGGAEASILRIDLSNDSFSIIPDFSAPFRSTVTSDVSLSSTDHAWQIGPSGGTNLAADNNELMARNNGSVSNFNLNAEGGDVIIGNLLGTSQRILIRSGSSPLIQVGGSTVWHAGNDGPGSGLVADTVDGYEGSELAALAENETITGDWTFQDNLTVSSTGDVLFHLEADTDNATETDNPTFRMSQDGGFVQVDYGIDSSNNAFFTGSGSIGSINFSGFSSVNINGNSVLDESDRVENGGNLPKIASGSFTTSSINPGFNEVTTITHGLGTDNVMVSIMLEGSDTSGEADEVQAVSRRPDGLMLHHSANNSEDAISQAPVPSSGDVAIRAGVKSTSSVSQTITVNYMITALN